MGSMPASARSHESWVTVDGVRTISPPRRRGEDACQEPAIQALQQPALPTPALLQLLRLPPRTKRVGGGYLSIPYSPEELLKAAAGPPLPSHLARLPPATTCAPTLPPPTVTAAAAHAAAARAA